MNILADRYQFRARIIPEFLTVFPLVILLIAFVKNLLVLGFLSFALFFIFFQGNFSSRLGRKLQKKLRKEKKLEWGSDFLCKLYEENKNDKYVLLLKSAAQKSGKDALGSFDESKKVEQIDQIIIWIKEQTRNTDNFPTVFDKNCDYGFYRNMLGMRYWALGTMTLTILLLFLPTLIIRITPTLCVDIVYPLFEEGKLMIGGVWFLLVVSWVVFWTKIISIKALNQASKSYIKALLKAVEGIDGEKASTSKEFTA